MRPVNLASSRNGLCKRKFSKLFHTEASLDSFIYKLRDDYFIAVVVICIISLLFGCIQTFESIKGYLQDTINKQEFPHLYIIVRKRAERLSFFAVVVVVLSFVQLCHLLLLCFVQVIEVTS